MVLQLTNLNGKWLSAKIGECMSEKRTQWRCALTKANIMIVTLSSLASDYSFSPNLLQFSNIFQNWSIYLLSFSLLLPAYRLELQRYAYLYSQLIGASIVIETVAIKDGWGPKFTRDRPSRPHLRFTTGNLVQIYLPEVVTYSIHHQTGPSFPAKLIRKSQERHHYYVFFVKTTNIQPDKFRSSLKSFEDI